MRRRFNFNIAEWYIVIIGVVAIFGALLLASYEHYLWPRNSTPVASSDTGKKEQAETNTRSTSAESPQNEAAKMPPAQTPAPRVQQAPPANPPAAAPVIASPHQSEKPAATMVAMKPAGGDPAAGRQVFRKCQACHSMDAGKNMLGPSLHNILGRKAGSEPGYSYSQALKQSNLVWDAATLNAYLADPQKTVPGNKMPFPGLKTEHDRSDIIAFLASSGDQAANLPAAAGTSGSAQRGTAPPAAAPTQREPNKAIGYIADAKYTLRTGIAEGQMVYIGVGGKIDGKVNPLLTAVEGQVVQITLINGEGAQHDIVFPDQDAKSPRVTGKGASTGVAFRAGKSGDFVYFCGVPGHRLAGMEGQFIVTPTAPAQTVVEADISRLPDDIPPPIGKRPPQTVRVDLLSVELEGRLAEGTTFGYWTFNGKVPGPFIRVRVGDTVDIHLKNAVNSGMIHSVDFHAATGPGGGAASLQVDPGDEKSITWKALTPGLYVYHCATPMVAAHIANGMYGLILVEPEEGLPAVDHEFYVMQGEIYTDAPYGQHGSQQFSVEKLLNERPEYFVFNGAVGAISKIHPLHAKVGETIRIFFGDGGPNFTSSFHVIGEIFDKVYTLGGLTTPPLEGIQTISVPPGGAAIAEFKVDVPGNYTLVDHALARTERGLLGVLTVEGPQNKDIYNGVAMPGMGH